MKVKDLCAKTLLKESKGHQASENIHMNRLDSLALIRYQYPKQLTEPVWCASNVMYNKALSAPHKRLAVSFI